MMPEPPIPIYVPSRTRTVMLRKNLPSIAAQGLPVYLVVDEEEFDLYSSLASDVSSVMADPKIEVLPIPSGRGIGYVRQRCLEHAASIGAEVMIQNDDDRRFLSRNARDLAEPIRCYRNVAVCGAWHNMYIRYLKIYQDTGVHPIGNGIGLATFAMDVQTALDVGGYDELLFAAYEDSEIVMRMVMRGIGPSTVHSGVVTSMTAGRAAPGGISSWPGERDDHEIATSEYLVTKFPDYIKRQKNGPRCRVAWKKIYTDAGFTFPLQLIESPQTGAHDEQT